MRMEQLRCLVDIAQTGSLTSTAQRLFVSQQAISKSMKQLEQELGIEILVRTNMGVQITPAGQKVVEFAQTVLREEEKMAFAIQGEREKLQETTLLKICSTSAVTNIVLPDIINELDAQQKSVKFKISMLDTLEAIFEYVANKECDLGLISFNADELLRRFSEQESELYLDILARDEMIALMHKRYLKSGEEQITGSSFLKAPLTLYNIIPVDTNYEDPRGTYLMYSNDADFHRAMMEKNGAIVIMPSLAQQHFFASKKIVPIELPSPTPVLHAAVYRKDAGQHIQEIVSMIRRGLQIK